MATRVLNVQGSSSGAVNVTECKQPLLCSTRLLIKPGAICAEHDSVRQGLLHPSSIMVLPDVEEVGAVQRRGGTRPPSVLGAAFTTPCCCCTQHHSQININTHCCNFMYIVTYVSEILVIRNI
jgi:hypothetical protein